MTPPDSQALAALRDIHLPETVSVWPLAFGWWWLISVLVGLAGLLVWFWRRRQRRAEGWQAASEHELQRLEATFQTSGDEATLAEGLSVLLRRSARARMGHDEVAALRGDAWFDFLCPVPSDDPCGDPDSSAGSREIVRELTQVAYRGNADDGIQADAWIEFVRRWIQEAA